ncbi:pyridoxal 5'-phosphate synthase glutaminase subunit PdxT [Oceanivirga miroungae]|uniref:Pyridoxal 5'-phosphate synthase subunit PdxT n=1 Tax=Oceanivirga miroungae TaxID=1130046 RepID=A0A6I8M938_9FUSO|nr:pyridoxal 5'-phosphate synthase glutaminase subunit PdxT [Oceanivirga miroungae]VWL84808.1 glutamine amidotransferase subunit PdxT [Oceanivirga miroungae]
MKIGVLALQGAFIEHEKKLEKLNVEYVELRNKEDLKIEIDGLIIPGGESTVISKLLKEFDMYDTIYGRIKNGLFVFGTCAGLILLAKEIIGKDNHNMGLMDIVVKRNAYGRQLGSFITKEKFNNKMIDMVFIRGPYIDNVGKDVSILSLVDNKIVAAREKNMLVTSFHPELTDELEVHKYFIEMIGEKNDKSGN